VKLIASTLLVLMFAAACGGDTPPPPPRKPGAAAAKPGAKGPAGKKVLLQARMHVEERVTCP
jgi:hypothetical protein